MEIKLNVGDKLNIPENCVATIKNNLITIEREPIVFKDGDILCSDDASITVIFKEYDNKTNTFISYYNDSDNDLSNTDWSISHFRPATEIVKQTFFKNLKNKGLYWNTKTKTMETIRKRAKKNDLYLCIGFSGSIYRCTEHNDGSDNANFASGNYYLPSQREQAEKDAQAIKEIFKRKREE